jgi:uncharacterized protein DUF4242
LNGVNTTLEWRICHLAASPFSLYVEWVETILGIIKENPMKKFVIEREIPNVGTLQPDQLREAAARSNQALHQLGPDIQWQESYVTGNKTFCIYLAKDESVIRRHAELSGFPATKITEITGIIDPTTASRKC